MPYKENRAQKEKAWCDRHRVGFRGMYKGKPFMYKIKLPKGAVRHHMVYIDADPNYGLIFCTRNYHRWLHADKKGVIRKGW